MSVSRDSAAGTVDDPEGAPFGMPVAEVPRPPRPVVDWLVEGAVEAGATCPSIFPTIRRERQHVQSANRTNRFSVRNESLLKKSTKSTSCLESCHGGKPCCDKGLARSQIQFTRFVGMTSALALLAAMGMFSALLGSIAARYRECGTMPDTTRNSLTCSSFESIHDQPGLSAELLLPVSSRCCVRLY